MPEKIKSFLTQINEIYNPTSHNRFHGVYDLILHYGKTYQKTNHSFIYGKAKHCYENALKLTLEHDFVYCEGLATCGLIPIPIEHAWCLHNGLVIDNTWEDGIEYYGVAFKTEFVLNKVLENGMYGLFNFSDKQIREWFKKGIPKKHLFFSKF